MKYLGHTLLFVGGVILGWAVTLYCLHPPAASGDSAAWVQAIGSIAAIIASAGLVLLQAAMARSRANEEKSEKDAVSISAFHGLAQHAFEVVGYVLQQLGDQTSARGFFQTFPLETIPSIEAIFDAFPIHSLPSKERVIEAYRLRGLLRVVRLFVIDARSASEAAQHNWDEMTSYRDEYLLALRRAVDSSKL